jgi:hypothetical protein
MIPHLYAIIISYALFVMAEVILKVKPFAVQVGNQVDPNELSVAAAAMRLLIMVLMLWFVVEDVGDLIQIDAIHPFRRSARFKLEVVIVLFYFFSFTFVSRGSYLGVFCFGLAICISAIWCNQWRQECRSSHDIDGFANLMRDGLYVTGGFFLLESTVFIWRGGEFSRGFNAARVSCFSLTFLLLCVAHDHLIHRFYPVYARRYLVSFLRRR